MTELLTRLLGQSLQDVILGGVVDLDCDPADFVPLLGCVYLDIAGHLIQLSRDERTIQLNVSCVDAVHLDCELEDTQRICRSSVGRYILTDPLADNRIARINLYTNKNDGVIAIEFILASCQVLFFDPSFIDGFNFGGAEQKNTWLINAPEHYTIALESLGTSY